MLSAQKIDKSWRIEGSIGRTWYSTTVECSTESQAIIIFVVSSSEIGSSEPVLFSTHNSNTTHTLKRVLLREKYQIIVATMMAWTLFTLLATTTLDTKRSPWSPAEWRIQVNIGREEGTWMPETWAASGARLSFPMDVMVTSDYIVEKDSEYDFMGGNSMRLTVLEDPTFVSSQGEQFIGIREEGAWKMQMPKQRGAAATLRFWVDVEQAEDLSQGVGAVRNDVALPAERIFFMSKCWREEDLKIAARKMKPFEIAAKEAQRRVDEQLSHETGDRRLDGTDPIETALGTISMAKLIKDRDDRMRELREAENRLPRNAEKLRLGFWPGTDEKLAIGEGTVAVRKKKLFGDEFHILGKWQAIPIVQKQTQTEAEQQFAD